MEVAVIQMCSGRDLEQNLKTCRRLADAPEARRADWILYPENAPFLGKDHKKVDVAEPIGGRITDHFCDIAEQTDSWVTLGSFPERTDVENKTYNTQVLIDASGEIVETYRKLHLFDVDISGGGAYCESDSIKRGTRTVVSPILRDRETWRVGLSICYDLRFPLLYRRLMDQGAEILTVPSAFTRHTGQFHWHQLLKARAIETQSYVLAPNQWGDHFGSRRSFGQSAVYDPWGQCIASASEGEGVISAVLDRDYLEDVRNQIPTGDHRVFNPEWTGKSE